jgi:RluA family pseudouridine synthase
MCGFSRRISQSGKSYRSSINLFLPKRHKELSHLNLQNKIFKQEKQTMPEQNQLHFNIPLSWAGRTLDSFLRHEIHLSRSQISALKRSIGIMLNSDPVWVSYRLQGGETITINVNPIKQNILPEEIPLTIVYEDVDLIVINKSAGMIVHPVGVYKSGTLANALVHHWQVNQQSASFHPVHRLDRLTSGLILIAKNPWAHQQLSLQIEAGNFHRLYLAICQGSIGQTSAKIVAPLKHASVGFRWEVTDEGTPAITRYRILSTNPVATLLAIKLFTGKTHQIRVHMAHLGNPLWGDPIYGIPDPTFPRPALHAIRLTFTHPRSHHKMKFTADLPEDFNLLIKQSTL